MNNIVPYLMRVQSQGNTLVPVVSLPDLGFGNETVKAANSYKKRAVAAVIQKLQQSNF